MAIYLRLILMEPGVMQLLVTILRATVNGMGRGERKVKNMPGVGVLKLLSLSSH